MRLRNIGTALVLANCLSLQVLSQKIVDQTSINPSSSVYLFGPSSIQAFQPMSLVGEVFPDFQTVSASGEIVSRDQIYSQALNSQKVPVVVFGRPSCNIMRSIYTQMVLPAHSECGVEFSLYHLANSIEAHATNGYLTPYFEIWNNQNHPAPQFPNENVSQEHFQPFNGADLLSMSQGFVAKMEAVGVQGISEIEDLSVLIDSPEGGFTHAFGGPAIVWVLNPITGQIMYEETGIACLDGPDQPSCVAIKQNLRNVVAQVKEDMIQSVGIMEQSINSTQMLELEFSDILGRNSETGVRIFYDPISKKKFIRPAQ